MSNKKNQLSREQMLEELYSRSETREESPASSPSRTSHKILAGGSALKSVKIDEIIPKEQVPPESIHKMEVEAEAAPVESPSVVKHSPIQDVKAQEVHQEIQAKIITGGSGADEVEGSASLTKHEGEAVSQDAAGDQVKATPITTEKEDQELIDETGEEESTQNYIANKIAAFEKDLALTCPIFRENVLKEQSTAAGKIYYSCPSNDCNFISWGKQHLIECKRCKNPFLVEATDKSGQIIMKCPRATC